MKKIILCLLLVLCNFLIIYGINQDLPVVSLKEKLTIHDKPDLFYFKFPRYLVVDKKGFICVKDDNQLLIFSPYGEFIKNIFNKGEGPGEMTDICGIHPDHERILVFNRAPSKLLEFNYSGDFVGESSISLSLYKAEFLTFYNNRFYFFMSSVSNIDGEAILDTKVNLFSVDKNGENSRDENIYYLKKHFMSRTMILNMHFVQIAKINSHSFYIANNGDYEVKYLDIRKKELSPFINKDHKRVRIKKAWHDIINPDPSPLKYIRKTLDAVLRILVYNDKIWLLTSNFIEKKSSIKVDVYDKKGKYEGSLYLKMSDNTHLFMLSYTPMALVNGLLYIYEQTDDGSPKLVCYKLENIPAWAL